MVEMVTKLAKYTLGTLVILLIAATSAYLWISSQVDGRLNKKFAFPPLNIAEKVKVADVKIGERTATVRIECLNCHGKDFGGKRFLDNPAMGKYYGGNLTPTELAKKSDEEIAQAIYYGVNKDGKPLVFMPSMEYNNLSVDDIAAVVAYLRTIPPVSRPNEPIQIGPVAKTLSALGKMPILISAEHIDKNRKPTQKPAETASVEFGKYLIEAGCAGCHAADMRGGPIPGGDPSWPPASNMRKSGIGNWKEDDFVKSMRTGVGPAGAKWREPMMGLLDYTKSLDDTELKAMWMYLQTLEG